MQTAMELLDGPLAGQFHELEFGAPPPDRLGLRDDDDPTLLHWYLVNNYRGRYDTSETRPLPNVNVTDE
jgi:hypothetical protein